MLLNWESWTTSHLALRTLKFIIVVELVTSGMVVAVMVKMFIGVEVRWNVTEEKEWTGSVWKL
jgi:hypothetical protein